MRRLLSNLLWKLGTKLLKLSARINPPQPLPIPVPRVVIISTGPAKRTLADILQRPPILNLSPTPEWLAKYERYLKGEITREEVDSLD